MQKTGPESFTGLKQRPLSLVKSVGQFIKQKAKTFAEKQIKDIAQDVIDDKPVLSNLKDKVARITKVGAGRRRRRRRVKKGAHKRRAVKRRGRRRIVRRRKKGGKKKCYKGTIFS